MVGLRFWDCVGWLKFLVRCVVSSGSVKICSLEFVCCVVVICVVWNVSGFLIIIDC